MYFYCWVEICTEDVDCAQHCTILCEYILFHLVCTVCMCSLFASPPTASEGERQRREAVFESDKVQLVSLGPLLLGHNNTELQDNPCVQQSTSKYCSAPNYSQHVMDQWQCFKVNSTSLPQCFR